MNNSERTSNRRFIILGQRLVLHELIEHRRREMARSSDGSDGYLLLCCIRLGHCGEEKAATLEQSEEVHHQIKVTYPNWARRKFGSKRVAKPDSATSAYCR